MHVRIVSEKKKRYFLVFQLEDLFVHFLAFVFFIS